MKKTKISLFPIVFHFLPSATSTLLSLTIGNTSVELVELGLVKDIDGAKIGLIPKASCLYYYAIHALQHHG